MKRWLPIALFALLFLSWTPGRAGSDLVWHSFDEGLDKALRENKPVLVDVYTEWCGWCKVMDNKTYGDAGVSRYLRERFVLVKLNPETDGVLTYKGTTYQAAYFTQMMGVNGYPATAFFASNADMITLVPGYIQATEFLHILEFIGDKHYVSKPYEAFLKEKGYAQ